MFSEVNGRLIVGRKIWDDFLILKRGMQKGISDRLLLFFVFVAQQKNVFLWNSLLKNANASVLRDGSLITSLICFEEQSNRVDKRFCLA